MDFESALKAQLSSITGLTNKVFPSYATEGCTPPYIVYHKYNRELLKCLDNSIAMTESTYAIIIFSESYSEIQTLYKRIRDMVNGFQNTIMGTLVEGIFIKDVDEGYDDDAKVHRMDIMVRTYFKE